MTRRTMLARLAVAVPAVSVVSEPRSWAQGTLSLEQRRQALWAAERAFAKTMADRDHAAFTTFVAEEGIFFGQGRVLRGRAEVAAGWKHFFDGPRAPFSWEPDRGEVLASGSLGMTSGPVRDPQGKRIGTFTTTWRLEPEGKWRVVFDIGCPPCSQ
jgi:ketosteroid isomerase-like protein